MKKVVSIFAVVLFSIASFAQEEEKTNHQFIGVAMSAWNNSDAGYKTVQFQPKYGYHFNQWFALGITFDYAFANDENAKGKSNMYGINPFIRLKYVCPEKSTNPIILFADLGVNYSVTKFNDKGYSDEINMYVGARPGIAYVLSSRFSIAAYFGFIGYRHADVPVTTNNGSGFTLSTNGLSLGLNIHF